MLCVRMAVAAYGPQADAAIHCKAAVTYECGGKERSATLRRRGMRAAASSKRSWDTRNSRYCPATYMHTPASLSPSTSAMCLQDSVPSFGCTIKVQMQLFAFVTYGFAHMQNPISGPTAYLGFMQFPMVNDGDGL